MSIILRKNEKKCSPVKTEASSSWPAPRRCWNWIQRKWRRCCGSLLWSCFSHLGLENAAGHHNADRSPVSNSMDTKNKETCRQKPWWVRESLKKRRSPSPLSQSMTQAPQQLLLRQDFDRSGMTVKRSVFQYNNVNKFNSTWHSNCVKHLRKDNPAFLRLYPSV